MTSAQLAGLCTTILCVAFFGLLLRRGHLRAKYAMLWIPVVTAMAVFSIVPGLLDDVARAIGIAYPPALLFMLSITLLLMISMHFSWELSRIEERMRILAEVVALRDADEPQRAVEILLDDAPPGLEST